MIRQFFFDNWLPSLVGAFVGLAAVLLYSHYDNAATKKRIAAEAEREREAARAEYRRRQALTKAETPEPTMSFVPSVEGQPAVSHEDNGTPHEGSETEDPNVGTQTGQYTDTWGYMTSGPYKGMTLKEGQAAARR